MDELKILYIYKRIFLLKARFIINISKYILPSYMNQMYSFGPFNETLQFLRSIGALDFYTPMPLKEMFKQSFSILAVSIKISIWLESSILSGTNKTSSK